jgi:hypothetical protein
VQCLVSGRKRRDFTVPKAHFSAQAMSSELMSTKSDSDELLLLSQKIRGGIDPGNSLPATPTLE